MKRFLALFALCLSCNPNLMAPGSKRYPAECREGGPILETVTWNVGLAPGVVSYATPRTPAVAEELSKFRHVGVMCLQEVWTQEAKDAIVAAMGLPEEQVYYVDTRGMGEEPPGSNVCSADQLAPISQCVREECSGLAHPEETTICANRECHDELVSAYMRGGRDCLDCLAASVGKDVDAVEAQCTAPAPGVTRAFDGQNGVMLISRWPLKDREWEMLPASYSNRVALYASIELEGRETLEVACAHISTWTELSPALKDEDGDAVFGDWDDEMVAQVTRISDALKRRAQGRPQLFLTDLNAGPEIGRGIKGDMPRVWSRVRALGFSSPAAQAERPFCSVCNGNTLRGPTANSKLIDHVLMRDPIGGSRLEPKCVRSLFDGEHARYFKGYGDGLMEEHLSDHYAVAVTFRYE